MATTAKFAGASSDASEVCRVHDGISMVYPASFYSQPGMKGRLLDPDGVLACKTDRLFDLDGVLACKTGRLFDLDGVLAYKTGAKRSDVRLISPRSPRPAKLGCPCRFTLNATFAHPFRTG